LVLALLRTLSAEVAFTRTLIPNAPVVGVITGAVVTPTVAEAEAEPPVPLQLTEYVVVALGETVTDPDVPDAVKLEPVHDVALVLVYLSVEVWPTVIAVGDAVIVAVGVGVTLAHGSVVPMLDQLVPVHRYQLLSVPSTRI
jgi:hypothetical protein